MGYPTDEEMLRAVYTPPPGLHTPPPTPPTDRQRLHPIAIEALGEAEQAMTRFASFGNAHEGFAVALEEGLELAEACDPADPTHVAAIDAMGRAFGRLFVEVMQNESKRDLSAMRKEAIQIAAMGLRFVHDVIDRADTP